MLREIYVERHGQRMFGSDNPSLTERGAWQAKEAAREYLLNIEFDAVYSGTHIRHKETTEIAVKTLGLSCGVIEDSLLTLTKVASDRAYQCALKGRDHPEGPSVGFRVDAWFKTDPALMNECRQRLGTFFRDIPRVKKIILAISSCPIIESAVLQPEKTRLLGDCGIIKYVVDGAGVIISSETIFEGFFEKPPQKKSS